jgi:hypothetical protein
MADQRPTTDLRGTEPARQASDPTLSERGADNPVGPTAPVQDSGPGVLLAVALLAIFLVVLAAAVITGFVR